MNLISEMVTGHKVWDANCVCPRHRHAQAYVAIILSGGYEESGSCGRFRVEPGDVLLHAPFEAHLDRFQAKGAIILDLALAARPAFSFGHVADVDEIARIARRDSDAAAALLAARVIRKRNPAADWPDLLAADLLDDPGCRLDQWAEEHGLAPETVSRGFGRVFALTPAAYRAEARARRAHAYLVESAMPLATVAGVAAFADQAHMSRAVKQLTGATPQSWRKSNPFNTKDRIAA